ncbi:gamma-glutamyltransferase [Pseudemcibacter aquimaris]|uniref:gamma-glutamyltransferase n=1 Tax=Pseudemcibacter aquimaris TaxID=2857064 RepID=UPI002011642F|nr:gamma-glutamyltransferase [Pseudemcibacter aquimaris]MCC3861284.1 gamma-glutamyltransferase [Pseudemcibacter aquimaris]WDU58058.1 gamma-glutamyltransferase [Pseudemcibacter aquimaris]
MRRLFFILLSTYLGLSIGFSQEKEFAGYVSSASPEATDVGVKILENGGNAYDAAVAVALALGPGEPAGSGIFGQTVMLVQPANGDAFVIHGTTLSPSNIPDKVTRSQLVRGRTASTVPSQLRVLDYTFKNYASGNFTWKELVMPAVDLYRNGIEVGYFRHKAFAHYGMGLKGQKEAAEIFLKSDGSAYDIGEIFKQPIMADTLERIANKGADEFYQGDMAREIAADLQENGGWITYDDLANFPEPAIVEPIKSTYRGYEVLSLPPPYGGWVMLQILNLLEAQSTDAVNQDNAERKIALLNAMRLGHGTRKNNPPPDFHNYQDDISHKLSKEEAQRMIENFKSGKGGETTHFSVVDAEGNAIAVTMSIDNYFGALVAHPTLGFLYNNYMQSFRIEDDGSPYVLKANEMPLSSMSGTIVRKNNETKMVLGSPASARIISAIAQVTSYWIDVEQNIEKAVSAFRVHVVPDDKAYIEGPNIDNELIKKMAEYDYNLNRPNYGVANGHFDPYFGGVHALANENGKWSGAADPRRDGTAKPAWKN